MKALAAIAAYQNLRRQPLWRLLAATNAPVILGLLQTHLYENERSLPASLLHERLTRDLDELRARGHDLPQTAQAYVADWLREGYLERRLPPGAGEETYELSTAGAQAIRIASAWIQPHTAATESRLTLVIAAMIRLAEDTDRDRSLRIARLHAERQRIDAEIAAIEGGELRVLSDDTALERAREIIALAGELVGDFRRVRDHFAELNRDLRERIMDSDGHRGAVLDAVFAGIDLIEESEAGRTFAAFWRLLTDPEQSARLNQANDDISARDFAARLNLGERRFLLRLARNLLDQGGMVHDVQQTFARSLKHFVQSREYLEQRRINSLLRDAQRAALPLKNTLRANTPLPYALEPGGARLRSLSPWTLYDPATRAPSSKMHDGTAAEIDLDSVRALVEQSEIDFRTLKHQIRTLLKNRSQISIGEILAAYPAAQGLGSIVGLLALARRYGGINSGAHETVSWQGSDGITRRARIPQIHILQESQHEPT